MLWATLLSHSMGGEHDGEFSLESARAASGWGGLPIGGKCKQSGYVICFCAEENMKTKKITECTESSTKEHIVRKEHVADARS